jgi:hypothetical protein
MDRIDPCDPKSKGQHADTRSPAHDEAPAQPSCAEPARILGQPASARHPRRGNPNAGLPTCPPASVLVRTAVATTASQAVDAPRRVPVRGTPTTLTSTATEPTRNEELRWKRQRVQIVGGQHPAAYRLLRAVTNGAHRDAAESRWDTPITLTSTARQPPRCMKPV